ncbi:MAG: conjugal transfer protein TraX, partial [Rickettsiales bacterium]|nr:conjugal transfer protein TraX [Rickettsiales bacterium]
MISARRAFDSWDALKVAAIFLMLVDHAGVFFFNSEEDAYWIRAVGRGAAPIFLFLAGYARNYRFSWELFGLAFVFTVFEWGYFWHINTLNILFTILVCRLVFQWFEGRGRVISRPIEWYTGATALFVTNVLVQYGSIGFLLALCGYVRRHEASYSKAERFSVYALCVVTYAAYQIKFFDPVISPVVASAMIFGAMAVCLTFRLREIT